MKKLTKLQQEKINHLINENLEDILVGRMIETDLNTQIEEDYSDSAGAIDTSAVSSQIEEVVEEAVENMYGKLPRLIKNIFQSSGINESVRVIDNTILHNAQIAEVHQQFVSQLVEMFNDHVAQVTDIVLRDQEDDF